MLARTLFSLNAGKRGNYSKASKVEDWIQIDCVEVSDHFRSQVTVEFVPRQFAPTSANIIPRSFFHCQAKLGKLR